MAQQTVQQTPLLEKTKDYPTTGTDLQLHILEQKKECKHIHMKEIDQSLRTVLRTVMGPKLSTEDENEGEKISATIRTTNATNATLDAINREDIQQLQEWAQRDFD